MSKITNDDLNLSGCTHPYGNSGRQRFNMIAVDVLPCCLAY